MRPSDHLLLSLAVGTVRAFQRRDPLSIPRVVVTGVLIDVDHVLDYSLRALTGKVTAILPLHGFDLLIGALLLLRRLPIAKENVNDFLLGYSTHLIADQVTNDATPTSYLFVARALRGFSHRRNFPLNPPASWRQIAHKAVGRPSLFSRNGAHSDKSGALDFEATKSVGD